MSLPLVVLTCACNRYPSQTTISCMCLIMFTRRYIPCRLLEKCAVVCCMKCAHTEHTNGSTTHYHYAQANCIYVPSTLLFLAEGGPSIELVALDGELPTV